MGLLKQLRPDHKTMADCRQPNLKPLRHVCRACTMLCKPLDRFAGERVAIDGSTCKAVNTKARTFPPAKLTTLLAQIDQRSEGSREHLDTQESQDDAGPPGGAVADQVQAKSEALQQRKRLSPELQAQ